MPDRILATVKSEEASEKDSFPFEEGITHRWVDESDKLLATFSFKNGSILVTIFDEDENELKSSRFNLEAGNAARPQIVIGGDECGLQSHKLRLVATQPSFSQSSLDALSATTFISYSLENKPNENIRLQIIKSN